MATFYHDSSRKSVFAERARQFGPISGPETCQVDLLEWSPGIVSSPGHTIRVTKYANLFILMYLSGGSTQPQPLIETNVQELPSRAQPRVQVVYVQPFHSTSTLTDLSFELCAFRYCPLQNWSWN